MQAIRRVHNCWLQPGRGRSGSGARDPHGALHPIRACAQEATAAAAEAQAAALLVRAEALRRRVIGTAAEYRRLFDWLLQTVRRLNDDAPAAAGAAARPAPDAPRLAAFLRGQFRADALAPLLAAEARRRAALCPSLQTPPSASGCCGAAASCASATRSAGACAHVRTRRAIRSGDDSSMRSGARGHRARLTRLAPGHPRCARAARQEADGAVSAAAPDPTDAQREADFEALAEAVGIPCKQQVARPWGGLP